MAQPTNLLTIGQCAERLGIGERHVRRLADEHGLGLTLGKRRVGISVEDMERLRALLKPGRGRKKATP